MKKEESLSDTKTEAAIDTQSNSLKELKILVTSSKAQDEPLLQELRLEGEGFIQPPPNPKYLRVYGHYLCPYVERTLITLAFKKIPYQFVSIDFPSRPAWYKSLKSEGRVPLLEFPNRQDYLAESAPICFYLDEVFDTGAELMPKNDPMLRANIRIIIGEIDNLITPSYKFFSTKGADKEATESTKKICSKLNGILKENKTKSPFFLDQPKVTFADILLLPHFRRMLLNEGTELYEVWKSFNFYEYPHLIRWYNNMMNIEEVCLHTTSAKNYTEWVAWRFKTNQATLPGFMSHPPFGS